MTSLNTILWSLGIALHVLLLTTLVLRGLARRLPAFTGLLSFYLVRSLVLYTLSAYLRSPGYVAIYSVLSTLDLVLQTVVAWELFCAARRSVPGGDLPSWLRRLGSFSVCVVLAAGAAWTLSMWVHGNVRTPIDRGVLFCSMLMLAVGAASLGRSVDAAARPVMQGFCALSLTGILCQVERTLAGLHRNAALFQHWSYPTAVMYLIVLSFWLMSLTLLARRMEATAHPAGLAAQA